MKVLREFKGIKLNEGNLMANGLFNLSNDADVSLWFNADTKDELLECTDDEFFERANELFEF